MERERIVVGVDGSAGSRLAVRWALGEAWHRRADVELISCWHIPYVADGYARAFVTPEDMSGEARADIDRVMTAFDRDIELLREQGQHIDTRILEGPAGPTLETESKGADLLVVGRRGRSPIGRLLLGSVSRHVAAHATCPVVVVPES
jgi:nucleotide-binding universal stress UspA family protein